MITIIKICQGHSCKKLNKYVLERANAEIENKKKSNIIFEKSYCLGQCAKAPNIVLVEESKIKQKEQDNSKILKIINNMNPIKISKIINNTK